ncbi:MAG: sugar-binding domain-containing protein, partial [Bacteroidaceae bacterium]
MKRTFYSFIYLFCSLFSIIPATAKDQAQSLAGIWHFALDKDNRGITEQWFKKTLQTSIALPGSCEQRGFGIKTTEPSIGRLTRIIHYEGKAWYQREFTIPKHWNGKRVELMLERCHWESNVWIDGNFYGMQNSLS